MEKMFYSLQLKSQRSKRYGLVFLDPHGDSAARLLSLALNQDRTRLKYVSSAINREADTRETFSACINPFENDGSEEMQYLLANEITDAITELLQDTSHSLTITMSALLRPCVATVLRSPEPSLETLARFFMDGHNDDLICLGATSNIKQHRTFFAEGEFMSEAYRLTRTSVRTKLSFYLNDPVLANLINGKSTVNVEKCLNDGDVLIFNLPKGVSRFASSVFGRLMIAYIHAIMLRRAAIDPKQRKQSFVFIDEFQTMLTSSLAHSLAESRKYGMALVLATQTLKAIDKLEVRKTVMVNTNLKAVSMTDYEDGLTFSKELGVNIDEIRKLQPLQFFVKKNDGLHKAIKVRVPILGAQHFLTKKERKELLDWLVYESGIYVRVPPLSPAPPIPESDSQSQPLVKPPTRNYKKKQSKAYPFPDDVTPAF